ncbi:Predicted protein [Taphrina deformans PYCC 5710]|uniref:Vacuolar membrane protein n=1 Tax=Taphrina deformans (strain PYCC 5710 / ATCC 11124 / CBS 356.35 / IMI 108563 / JCM 9778 / NBRC 8474) TaxID=1097556 RepID=R4XE71_TAPDE|nr:Predicted protein [Taphrina deformans PYCC 5710]|eukprot:CCG82745.1 Predicted protein [Taphrina deformans PYCC 5710]
MDIAQKGAKCELLGPFAILVQSSLGALAILSLFYKRQIESPRRPFIIWFFDVSKQLFGAVMVHFLNIAMSTDPDVSVFQSRTSPCTWYFLNVLLDTTVGVGLIWLLLRTLSSVCSLFQLQGTTSGVYGNPPKWTWWLKQSTVYTIGLALMKTTVFIILTTIPQLSVVGNFLLKWSERHEKLRIFFVMFFFPLVMNIVQYVIIDNIVMSKGSEGAFNDGGPVTHSGSGSNQASNIGRKRGQDDERSALIHE